MYLHVHVVSNNTCMYVVGIDVFPGPDFGKRIAQKRYYVRLGLID